MGTFSEQSFGNRFKALGDEAEGIFEEVYPRGWAPFGLRRPPISLSKVPPFIRFMPDFLTSNGLVEAQGFGRDQMAKFKDAKVDALTDWEQEFRVTWFLWDKTNRRFGYVPHDRLRRDLLLIGLPGAFDGGKNPFLSLHADDLPVDEWIPYEAQPSRSR